MMSEMKRIAELAKEAGPEIVSLRRHFHTHPEMSWEEVRTTDRIEEELTKLGIKTTRRSFGGTSSGLIADIKGGQPGKCVALRADIDALPVTEENTAEYKSQNCGVMHACGHDAHAACLIGAAKVLMQIRDTLKGTVRLLFQPAEEFAARSGAEVMVQEGAIEGVDAMFGLHVFSNVPSGVMLYRSGPCFAACDSWEITIQGRGGHGSAPDLAADPTIPAFHLGTALQTVISREVSPRETAVLSVGSLGTSSNAFNIIPERVKMRGTVRTFQPAVQDAVESGLRRVATDICSAFRCTAEISYDRSIPSTHNDPAMTDILRSALSALFPSNPELIQESPLVMGSEDFSYFANVVPATYLQMGTADPKRPDTAMPHHSARFDVDESQLWRGAAAHAAFAFQFLNGR